MSGVQAVAEIASVDKLMQALTRRGVDEFVWRALCDSVYPGAEAASILMVIDYCKAKGLDPLKKPCHIVPMEVYVKKTGQYEWRDVVMPGIYEYRTTAHRTGFYLGHDDPTYGEEIEFKGLKVPEWCRFLVKRWNPVAEREMAFPEKVWFAEMVALTKRNNEMHVNARWSRAPIQMLTKCAEAAALRAAFPEALGGTHTDEEMVGRTLNAEDLEGGKTDALKKPQPKENAPETPRQVPLKQIAAAIDEIGLPLNEFLANFEIGTLEELPLKDVPAALKYLDSIKGTPP